MDDANSSWTGYNHHHLVHVTSMSVEVIITYLLLFIVTAAIRLDRESVDQNSLNQNSISEIIDVLVHDEDSTEGGNKKIFSVKNDIHDSCRDTDYFGNQVEDKSFSSRKYPEFEYQKRISLKLHPVRAELPAPVYNITDDIFMPVLKQPEGDQSETNPKWVCGSKWHLSSQQKSSWKSSETSLQIKDKELQVLFQLDTTATTKKEAFGVETDLKSSNQDNGFKRAQLKEESLLPRSVSWPTKHEDVDSNQVTLKENGFLETHEDGLHMYFWNDLDFDSLNSDIDDDDDDTDEIFQKRLSESSHSCSFKNFSFTENALEEQKKHTLYREKILPVSDQLKENKNIYISPSENEDCIDSVELQGLIKASMIEDKLNNTDLQQCQELNICENMLACVDKSIMQSEGVESNMTEKSFSDKCIQVGLTETVCCGQMEVGTYYASHENKMVSTHKNTTIKVENDLDSSVVSLDKDKEIDIFMQDPLKGNMLHVATGPDENSQNGSGKHIIEERAEKANIVRNEVIIGSSPIYRGSNIMDLTSEQLILFTNKRIPENEKQKVKDETSEEKSKYGFHAAKDCVVNLESIEKKEFCGDTLTSDEDKEDLMHPHYSERHNFELDSCRNEKYSSQCTRGRKHSRQMEHGGRKRKEYRPPSRARVVRKGSAAKIELGQSFGQFLDLKSRAVHIIEKDILEAMTDAVPVDCRRYQGLEEEHISDCQRRKMDKYGPLNNKKQQLPKVPLIPFQDNLMRTKLLKGGRLVPKENQDQKFKMKKVINTDKSDVKNVSDQGKYAQEKLSMIVRTFFACKMTTSLNDTDKQNDSSTFDGKFHRKGKSKWKKLNFYQDAECHDILELLQELVSTWYFYPMLCRNMEFCLPSSLQACFERLINGPPISLEERMSYEWLRLQSFNTFPSSAWGISVRMAESGFYYTGQGTHTRCYACNVGHEGWNNTDNPHEVHRRISPNCPFLRGNPTYPNFPIIPDTMHNGNSTVRSGSIPTPSFPVVSERMQSRVPEPYPQTITAINSSRSLHQDEMSVAPSACTNDCHQIHSETKQDEVRWINLETQSSSVNMKQQQTSSTPSMGTSQPESSPRSTSLRHPQQPRIVAENTQYMNPGNFVLTLPAGQEEDPGVTRSENPKHPEHAPLSSRINSYTGWPIHLDQTPQQMAEAGFYYAGIMDHTRCFQCGGGLRNWASGDNPWIEHARWYPQCAYVLCKRGQKFVNAVLKKQAELLAAQNTEQNNSGSTTTTNDNNIKRSGTPGTCSESQSAQSQSGQPRYFQNPHENDIASRLIEEMGYQRERVREAILEVKRMRGQQQITIEHALYLLLADEERMAVAGRRNEAATVQELIQESGRLTLHEDNNPAPSPSSPVAQTTTALTPITLESYQGSGRPNHFAGGRSSVQQHCGQTKHSTHLGQDSSVVQGRQNISGPVSIAVDVPLSSPFFGNRDGHQSNKSTAGNKPSSPPLLEPASLPALDAESLREEYLRLRDQNKCKVCRERNVELAFLPCGHLVCCEVCGQTLRFCPICQAKIHASVKTYLS